MFLTFFSDIIIFILKFAIEYKHLNIVCNNMTDLFKHTLNN